MILPHHNDVAHDLRNLVGVIRALTTELAPFLGNAGEEARQIAHELDAQTRFAMDALRVLERWDHPDPVELHLGAWAWALRLLRRDLIVGDLTGARVCKAVVPKALEAGLALIDAIGSGRIVRAELIEGGVLRLAALARTSNPAALGSAIDALVAVGIPARMDGEVPCRVRVG